MSTGLDAVAQQIAHMGLPASQHTERVVLGAMCDNPAGLDEGLELLAEAHFSLDSNRRVFAAMRRMADSGKVVNTVTLMDELTRTRELAGMGGDSYLFSLLEGSMRMTSLRTYADTLRQKAAQRATLQLIESVALKAVDPSCDPEETLAELTQRAYEIESGTERVSYVHVSQWVPGALTEMVRQRDREDGLLGITTGVPDLDAMTTGYRDGELTYIGAAPGRGKTSLLLQGLFTATRDGMPAGLISLEMRSEQLVRRLTVMASKLAAWKLRDAKRMNASDFQHALREMEHVSHLPIYATDHDGLRPHEITSMARRMVRQEGVRILFVDFVQIVREESGRNAKEAIDRVSAALRSIAKTLNIPVVVASQLARRENDPNRRPTLHDLRESGNLEQDAHNVLLLYRPIDRQTNEFTGEDEVIVAKCREGAVGKVDVIYDQNLLTYQPRGGRR